MSTITYDIGDIVPITWLLEVGGTPTNGTVAVTVIAPDGTITTPSVTNGSTGHYSTSHTATMAGTYVVRWVSTGAVIATDDRSFYVGPNEAGRDYCTLAELKHSLGIPATDTNDDDALERAIRAASRAVDKHCRRRFWQDTAVQTRTFAATGSTVWIDDVSTLTGLIVATDDNDDGTAETTWTINSDFVMSPRNNLADGRPVNRIDVTGNRWLPQSGRRNGVHVTARFGWPAVPEEVREATILKAARIFGRKDSPLGVAGSSEFGVIRVSRFEDPDVTMLLADFCRGVVGV